MSRGWTSTYEQIVLLILLMCVYVCVDVCVCKVERGGRVNIRMTAVHRLYLSWMFFCELF